MNHVIVKLGALLLIVGAFAFFTYNDGMAVTSDQTNSVNLQATVTESMLLNSVRLASAELVGVAAATDILLVTYDASAANDYTPGSAGGFDFTADDGTTWDNSFDNDAQPANACVALSFGMGWDQFGQAGRDNKASFIGAPDADTVINVDDLTFADTALGALGAVTATYADCSAADGGGEVSALGYSDTDATAGNNAEVSVRSATTELGFEVQNLKTDSVASDRKHPFQVKIEAL